jgi:hypothetical protein
MGGMGRFLRDGISTVFRNGSGTIDAAFPWRLIKISWENSDGAITPNDNREEKIRHGNATDPPKIYFRAGPARLHSGDPAYADPDRNAFLPVESNRLDRCDCATTIASRFQVLTSFFFVAGTFRKVAISTGEAFGEICFVSVATVQTIERTPDLTANVIPIKKSKCQLKLDLGKFMLLNL